MNYRTLFIATLCGLSLAAAQPAQAGVWGVTKGGAKLTLGSVELVSGVFLAMAAYGGYRSGSVELDFDGVMTVLTTVAASLGAWKFLRDGGIRICNQSAYMKNQLATILAWRGKKELQGCRSTS